MTTPLGTFNVSAAVWLAWIIFTLGSFAVLEITGYIAWTPWGTLTIFIRTEEAGAGIIRWVLLIGLSILTVHLCGDWP